MPSIVAVLADVPHQVEPLVFKTGFLIGALVAQSHLLVAT